MSLNLETLRFRRQFFLGPEPLGFAAPWILKPLPYNLFLSIHPDVPFVSMSKDLVTITLIGQAVDALNPEADESKILEGLLRHKRLGDLLDSASPLAGRWAVIFQDTKGTYLFTDPSGFRQVFYHWDGKNLWCASQPELIREHHPLKFQESSELSVFLRTQEMSGSESAWIGPKTVYQDCYHLLPNNYLDLFAGRQVRFYPNKELKRQNDFDVVDRATSILQKIMVGVARRYGGTFGLTAGWDSRMLLAAAKSVKDGFEYFIDRHGKLDEDDPDVQIPKELCQRLGLRFKIHNSKQDCPGWFNSILCQNVTSPRVLPKTRMIYGSLLRGETRMNTNGNAGEISRNPMDKYWAGGPDVPTDELVHLMGYWSVPPFAMREITEWRKSLENHGLRGFSLLDFLYWEQRLGNWGALFPAEQDISIEEISPFNCRLLIETLMSASKEIRNYPDHELHREIIHRMWPEVLSLPINPPRKGEEHHG